MNDMYIAYSWIAVSLAAFGGFWLHLHYRRRDRLQHGPRQEQLEALAAELHEEVEGVASELHERLDQLHERIDFTERLLTERSVPELPAPSDHSAEPTPV